MKRLVRTLLLFVVVFAVGLPALAVPLTYPVQVANPWPIPDPPSPTAASWIVYDDTANAVIAARHPDEERAMASVTKVMTGLLVVERADFDDTVTVSARAAATGEKEIGLVAGEELRVEDLFHAMMIHSANDAATALAEHVGGSLEGFVELMNQRAAELGMDHTSFANPHGLDAPNHYTTAKDLLTLAEKAMEFPEFAETVRTPRMGFPPAPDGTPRLAESTNLMLSDYPGMLGVKTGFTNRALLTFVAAAERDGRRILVVVLGSDGRRAHFADAKLLLDYTFNSMPYLASLSSGRPYVAIAPRITQSPLTVASDAEAMVHLAGQGLFRETPAPLGEVGLPEPPPVVETIIEPARGPDTLWDSLLFWFSGANS